MQVGVWHEVVDRLTAVPLAERQRFLSLLPTRAAHATAQAAVRAFTQVELQPPPQPAAPSNALRVAAWNLERCLYPDHAARILARHGVGLALLTEMDVGVLRTGQAHTIGRVAAQLGHGYCYGLEFLEVAPTEPPDGLPRHGSDNSEGFHGNGIASAWPLRTPIVIRLDEEADWYASPEHRRRIGSRMAVAATVSVGAQSFVACAVHLENRTDGAGRARQMRTLLDALDDYAGGRPVLIGGDLNTHVGPGGHQDASEPLFALAAARGYDWASGNIASPTTRDSTWSRAEGTRQLDWFCARGVRVRAPAIVPALAEDATVLSDHELLLLTLDTG